MLFWILYFLAFLPVKIFYPYKIYGRKNIVKKQNYIIACNHLSYFDPMLLDYVFKSRNRYLAKKELFNKKSAKFWLGRIFGGIAIDRAKGLTPSQIREVSASLSKGQNMGIFVDGTRKEFSENDDIKGGACYFAIRTKTPLIPCFIASKQKFLRKNKILVGEPFELSSFYDKKIDKETLSLAENILKEKISFLKEEYERSEKEKLIAHHLKKQK